MMVYSIWKIFHFIHYTQNPSLDLPHNIHQQIICTTENDKKTEVPIVKTPGQKLRHQLVSSLILKQNMPTGIKAGGGGGRKISPQRKKTGAKECKQPVKWL